MGSDKREQFGQVPSQRIRDGALRGMVRGAALVYLALSACTGPDWTCRLTLDTLRAYTGMSRRGLQMAIQSLENGGHITVKRGTHRGQASVYTLSRRAQDKGRSPADGRAQDQTTKGAEIPPEGRTPECTPSTEQLGTAVAGGGAAAAFRVVLEGAGIGAPKLDSLSAALEGDQVPMAAVRRAISQTQEQGKGTGLLVRRLEDLTRAAAGGREAQQRDKQQRRQRQQQACRQAQADQDARGQVAQEKAARDSLLGSLGPEGFATLADTIRRQWPDLFKKSNPHTSQPMRQAMARHLRHLQQQADQGAA